MKNVYLKTFGIATALFFLLTTFTMANTIDDIIYDTPEKQAEFNGGQNALYQFISDNIKYPTEALEAGISGTTLCQFIVEKDGSISNITILKSSGNEFLDKEAIRSIKTMPNWIPGVNKGENVRVRYTFPIVFRIE